MSEVSVRYVTSAAELHHPDMIFLPGSKNTMADLNWMRQNGLEAVIKKLSKQIPVFGICGGYQMLGTSIHDPDVVEEGGMLRGMELLPVKTVLQKQKRRCQLTGSIGKVDGVFSELSGLPFQGYEIHMGSTTTQQADTLENVITDGNNVYGSYIHGLFDRAAIAEAIIRALAQKKGVRVENGVLEDYQAFKEAQYDRLAQTLREYLDMEQIYGMLTEADIVS